MSKIITHFSTEDQSGENDDLEYDIIFTYRLTDQNAV